MDPSQALASPPTPAEHRSSSNPTARGLGQLTLNQQNCLLQTVVRLPGSPATGAAQPEAGHE